MFHAVVHLVRNYTYIRTLVSYICGDERMIAMCLRAKVQSSYKVRNVKHACYIRVICVLHLSDMQAACVLDTRNIASDSQLKSKDLVVLC